RWRWRTRRTGTSATSARRCSSCTATRTTGCRSARACGSGTTCSPPRGCPWARTARPCTGSSTTRTRTTGCSRRSTPRSGTRSCSPSSASTCTASRRPTRSRSADRRDPPDAVTPPTSAASPERRAALGAEAGGGGVLRGALAAGLGQGERRAALGAELPAGGLRAAPVAAGLRLLRQRQPAHHVDGVEPLAQLPTAGLGLQLGELLGDDRRAARALAHLAVPAHVDAHPRAAAAALLEPRRDLGDRLAHRAVLAAGVGRPVEQALRGVAEVAERPAEQPTDPAGDRLPGLHDVALERRPVAVAAALAAELELGAVPVGQVADVVGEGDDLGHAETLSRHDGCGAPRASRDARRHGAARGGGFRAEVPAGQVPGVRSMR